MKLTYRIEDNKIISDQPSSPREEITNFRLENNKLELEINNKFYKYRRINQLKIYQLQYHQNEKI